MRGARSWLLALLLARLAVRSQGTPPAAAVLAAETAHGAASRSERPAGAQIAATGSRCHGPAAPLRRRTARAARPRPGARGLRDAGAAVSPGFSGGGSSVSQVCVEESLMFRSNTPYHTDTMATPGGHGLLFCVQLDDSKLNYFQQPQHIKDSDFSKFLEKYGEHSFLAPSQIQTSFSAFYRVGDPILIYFDSSSVLSTLRQPVKTGASGLCVDGNPAGFLDNKSTSCTRIFANLSKSCITDPALDAAFYYRDFTVLKVIYEIEFSGTRGIQSVSVRFKVSNVSVNSGSSLQQHFTLHFWTRTLSDTLPRSGNPGYITGAPLLIANNGAMQHMSILRSEGDGGCSQFLRHTVQFGRNMRTGCKFSLSPILEESNCSYIQQKLYEAFQGMNRAEDLAITGSSHSTQAEEWTAILIQNCSVQAVNCTSCCMVPVILEIQILWTKLGLLSNPQAQILGARYFYQCQPLKFLNTSKVPLTTVVTFADMTEWPEPPRGQPQGHWKLPYDIFYPFKVVLNLEGSYRDYLAGYFFLTLIISSILCF
ncbi:tectonic-3 isoform X2 [Colius striatus]|uniref:tectonic-3 isoform X2 n=1 Tax=Colius striatus TaxID=57412 RepID=UPI002B1E25C4|nr:tectonic-3 isoform X2 [Colius striatus]